MIDKLVNIFEQLNTKANQNSEISKRQTLAMDEVADVGGDYLT